MARRYEEIGRLKVQRDWLNSNRFTSGIEARQAVVEPAHERLSITRQGGRLGRSRSAYYCRPQAVSEADLACRRRMDEIFMQHPFFGSPPLRNELAEQGRPLGRNHVRPHDATDGTGNDLPEEASEFVQSGAWGYPCLLRDLARVRPDQVWCSCITYLRLQRGFAYLVTIRDWFSRSVRAWEWPG